MSATLAQLGNSLHDGTRSAPIVRRRRLWYLISVAAVLVLGTLAVLRGPNLGIEFTGGSEFQISGVQDTSQTAARDIVREHVPDSEPKVTVLGGSTVRVQTEQLDSAQTSSLASDLAAGYDVESSAVSTSYIGPVWSQDITQKMLRGVLVFLVLVAIGMALYFRDLRASGAAMIALIHDMLLTAAVYGVVGFEITPSTVIGFLTILGYSLYDTIVVFDKVRENTAGMRVLNGPDYADRVELAANQTLVRSLNTSVVALLPVGSILVIGAFVLGAGTLKDISLALFVGILAGTYSSVFLAPGLLVDLHRLTSRAPRGPVDPAPRTTLAERRAAQERIASGTADDASDGGPEEGTDGGNGDDEATDDAPDDAPDAPVSVDSSPDVPPARRVQPRRSTRSGRSHSRRGQR
ncbi:protein translocase subunit SecF [Brachybacterium squillarum]|uniref:protein translocase subunit SecF n=1 Tax=Brachybacterium squillarum TaxID=661979 RepID=UPI0022230749|nr:protein translocase subunit SecF [Brachybacterium squillarum]MCW1805809.1 protein translocase subunit SecF [Brachybacterium squillarum]